MTVHAWSYHYRTLLIAITYLEVSNAVKTSDYMQMIPTGMETWKRLKLYFSSSRPGKRVEMCGWVWKSEFGSCKMKKNIMCMQDICALSLHFKNSDKILLCCTHLYTFCCKIKLLLPS